MVARLVVVDGPEAGSVYELREVCHLGRALDCQVQIQDLVVSRRHARISQVGSQFEIEDLGSGNGTFLNGKPVKRTLLTDGDVISISKMQLRFEQPQSEAPEPELVTMVGGPTELPPKILNMLDAQRPMIEGAFEATDFGNANQVRRMAERLRTVYKVSEAISSILDIEQLLPEILNHLFEVWPAAERAFVMLIDERDQTLIPKAVKRRHARDSGEITVSRTILNEVMTSSHAVLSRDAMADARFLSGQSVANFGIRSMMAAPLIWRRQTLGIVYLDSQTFGAFARADLELLTGIAGQAAVALGNARLHGELLKRQRLEQDLGMAVRIQQSFLPRRIPRIPSYAFAAYYEPAYEVGGDFYDFISLPPNRMGVVVGDVSGKGVSAALYMARLTRDLRYFALQEPDPGRVLARMNRAVEEAGHDDIFVTLLYAVMDLGTGLVLFGNAGHMPPVVLRGANLEALAFERGGGLPLGVLADTDYQTQALQLGSGDALLLYTDGLVEAMSPTRQMLGMDRMLHVAAGGPATADLLMKRLIDDLRNHVADAPQFDDTTIVCVGKELGDPG